MTYNVFGGTLNLT